MSASTPTRRWLDDDHSFTRGPHQGELAEDIARYDPTYIRWLTATVADMNDYDRCTLVALLAECSFTGEAV